MLAIRPRTLPAAVAPVVVGTAVAVAGAKFAFLPALAALVGCLLLQVGVNLANDYFDYTRGIDDVERLGPVRVTQGGLIAPETVKRGMLITFALAVVVGIYLVAVGGLPILLVGAVSILAALAYSGGPYPLASHGLGDLFVFIFFGPVAVCGTYYVQALDLSLRALVVSVPVGLLITAILVVNNLRDIETDRQVEKNTMAVILGVKGSRIEYAMLLALSCLVPFILWLLDHASLWIFLPYLSLPYGFHVARTVFRGEGPVLNEALAATAKLALVFSLFLSLGLLGNS
jgi:1,4-dihydroxy-2-naphthoate octaprenyltransferase